MNAVGAVVIGVVFLVVYALIGGIALRQPLLARLAFREAARRPLQSAVVVAGLMIGTGTILGAMVFEDSVHDSLAAAAGRSWGRVDLTVSAGGRYFSPDVATRVAGDPNVRSSVAGVQAGLEVVGSVVDVDRDQAKANVRLIAFDPATQAPFGAYVLSDGTRTNGTELTAGHVFVSSWLAEAIEAHRGDRIQVLVGGRSVEWRIAGITLAEGPGAYGLRPAVFIPLPTMQTLLGTDLINVVRVTTRGESQAEIDTALAAAPTVRAVVAADSTGVPLEVRADKAIEADAYKALLDANRPYFIVLSLFVVTVGVALLVNLALTLAEERRPRMAVLRALGLTRAGLVRVSMIEGAVYSLVAALISIVPAALIGWSLFAFAPAFERGAINGRDVVFEASVRPATVATSLAAGALITVVILYFASIGTSHMAIASAIRQLPEPSKLPRDSWLRRAAMLALGLGALSAVFLGNPPLRLTGGVALIMLASMMARSRISDRVRATLAGLAVTSWSFGIFAFAMSGGGLGTDSTKTPVLLAIAAVGTSTSVLGLSFVLAANLRLVEAIGLIPGRVAAGVRVSLRPALAYLTRRPLRAGLTTGAFALVVAMQAVASVSVLSAGRADYSSTQYRIVVTSSGAPDLSSMGSAVERQLAIPTRIYVGPARGRMTRYEAIDPGWRYVSVPLYSLSDAMLREPIAVLKRGPAAAPNQAALWARLRDDPTAVVASFGAIGDTITLKSPRNGEVKFTVIANFARGFMSGIAGSTRALIPFEDLPSGTTVLIRTAPGSDPAKVAAAIRRAVVGQGADATTTNRLLDDGGKPEFAALAIIRILMAVGMVVAVFSLGVLALRAVVERRRAIGLLRALGYQPRQILAGMLGESLLSATLGVAVGLAAGVFAGRLIVSAGGNAPPALVDELGAILLIYLGVLTVTMAVTAWPALRASRMIPVEALRVVD